MQVDSFISTSILTPANISNWSSVPIIDGIEFFQPSISDRNRAFFEHAFDQLLFLRIVENQIRQKLGTDAFMPPTPFFCRERSLVVPIFLDFDNQFAC